MTKGYTLYTCGGLVDYAQSRWVTLPYIGKPMGASEISLPYCENTAKKLMVIVTANTLDLGAYFTLYVNGVASQLRISVGAGLTGLFADTDDVAIADQDYLSVKITTSGNLAGSITFTTVICSFLLP